MAKNSGRTAARYITPEMSMNDLREAAATCRGCDLYKQATQTVFGEGTTGARILLVGEQPGDAEDRAGRPFMGPAGRLLDRALEEAGVERSRTYVTNVVKHFKWIQRGKRRLHQKPRIIEIDACSPWLLAEIEHVKPSVIVCLGATAAQALLGRAFRVSRDRGKPIPSNLAQRVVATVHPSSLLRMTDAAERVREFSRFVADLRTATEMADAAS